MAAVALTPAQQELVSSLTQDEIPIKLRCATCSKLALNAFRLPCCDQAICETCQSSVSSTCPVCEHTPVAAEDCKPHKSLRTTIRVFLRTEEKKRDALRQKASLDDAVVVPTEALESTPTPAPIAALATASALEPNEPPEFKIDTADVDAIKHDNPVQDSQDNTDPKSTSASLQQNDVQQSIEDATEQETVEEDLTKPNIDMTDAADNDVEENEKQASIPDEDHESATTELENVPAQTMGMGFNGMPQMGMGNGTDFNQMQMMMAMQSGMPVNGFGGFPMGFSGMPGMPGMPGLPLDPMAMQSMFMNGGFGTGMNGLGMAGMPGFDNGSGAGFNNGWNGQQAWNYGQNNFNHQNIASMGHGDFGASNPGFNGHHAIGHNQGNYGTPDNHNNFQTSGFAGRGRGRGRGGYGFNQNRGGHHHQNDFHQQRSSNGYQNNPNLIEMQNSASAGEKEEASVVASNVDEFGREIRESTDVKTGEASVDDSSIAGVDTETPAAIGQEGVLNGGAGQGEVSMADVNSTPQPISTVHESVPPTVLPSGFTKGGFQPPTEQPWPTQNTQFGYGVDPSVAPVQQSTSTLQRAPDVPINAPKGPKAMRDGLPNVSINFLRGRGSGYGNAGRPALQTNDSYGSEANNKAEQVVVNDNQAQESKADLEPEYNAERDHSQTPRINDSRDQSRDRSRERRHERRRERESDSRREERSGDERDDDDRRDRHRRRSRKHDDETANEGADDRDDNGDEITRSRSPSESRRSGHRSRRDRDGHRSERERESERDREKGRDYKSTSSSKGHRSSHRSHRDRSRSRSNTRHSRSNKDRDRSREHRSSRRSDEKESSSRDKDRDRDSRDKYKSSRSEKAVEPMSKTHSTATIATSNDKKFDLPLNIPRGPRAMSNTVQNKPVMSTSNNGVGIGIGIKGSASRQQAQQQQAQQQNQRDTGLGARITSSRTGDSQTSRNSHHQSKDSRNGGFDSSGTSKKAIAPVVDAHTLERETRNRERLLKEAQRMASLVGGKRSRDDDKNSSRKKRRSEVETSGGGLEDRIAKGERDRDSSRWE